MQVRSRFQPRSRILLIALAVLPAVSGCADRLAELQARFQGAWVLESRQYTDGALYRAPQVQGSLTWVPVDSRRAHVSLHVLQTEQGEEAPRTYNYAASTYEISTSAITQKRHLLIRQGYRSSANLPITIYKKAKTSKGKISETEGALTITHDEGFSQVFEGDRMVATYPGAFTDTWRRLN